jgi:hypothetical protein
MLAAIQRHQSYLASGNGLPKDELARWELQLSHGQVGEKLREYIRELEAELAYKDQHDISESPPLSATPVGRGYWCLLSRKGQQRPKACCLYYEEEPMLVPQPPSSRAGDRDLCDVRVRLDSCVPVFAALAPIGLAEIIRDFDPYLPSTMP